MVHASEIFIKGLGVFLPPIVDIMRAAEEGLYQVEDIELHELGGAAVAGDMPAPEMALFAAQEAFKRCGQRPDSVDLLLYTDSWHQGPDGWQPQYYLQRHLIGGSALAVETRHGCNGVFSALELAAGYLHSDPVRKSALIVAADNFGTPLIDRWHMGPGYIAGDGACAIILAKEPSFAQLLSVCTTTVSDAEEAHRGGEPLFPPGPTIGRSLDFTARTREFNRKAMVEGTGTAVWVTVHHTLLKVVDHTLRKAGIEIDDVTRVAFMNYSREIVEQRCMMALGLPMSKSTWGFGRSVGHLAASDQIVSLDHLLTTGQLGPGDHMLMLGVGPGVTISSAVVKIHAVPPWVDRAAPSPVT